MGGSLSEGLRTVFAVLLACMVIGFVFLVWRSVKESGNSALTQTMDSVTQMDEAKYTQYDGLIVTGSEVVNLIRQHSNDDICIQVTTDGGTYNYIRSDFTSLTGTTGEDVANVRDKNSAQYISPNKKFKGEVKSDEDTGAILGLIFTAQ